MSPPSISFAPLSPLFLFPILLLLKPYILFFHPLHPAPLINHLPFFLTFDLLCCLPASLHPPVMFSFSCSLHFMSPCPIFIISIIPTPLLPLLSSLFLVLSPCLLLILFSFILSQNHERETALHCAAQYGHSEVVSVLLQELTDPTMRNSRHETPLDLAALYGRLQVSDNDILVM